MPRLRLTWVKSKNGFRIDQKRTVKALGFHRLNETIEHDDTPAIRGMVHKIQHLLRVEEIA